MGILEDMQTQLREIARGIDKLDCEIETIKSELGTDRKIKDKELLTLKGVSEAYSIPLSTLRTWASRRQIPVKKIGRSIKVDVREFEEWLNKKRGK